MHANGKITKETQANNQTFHLVS